MEWRERPVHATPCLPATRRNLNRALLGCGGPNSTGLCSAATVVLFPPGAVEATLTLLLSATQRDRRRRVVDAAL